MLARLIGLAALERRQVEKVLGDLGVEPLRQQIAQIDFGLAQDRFAQQPFLNVRSRKCQPARGEARILFQKCPLNIVGRALCDVLMHLVRNNRQLIGALCPSWD